MNSIKWRIKAILEYYGFQKKISVRRREAVVKYNKASDRLYFIAGCGRSGTTLLGRDRKSTRLNSSHIPLSRMPSSA